MRFLAPLLLVVALAGCGGSSSSNSGSNSSSGSSSGAAPTAAPASLTASQNHVHSIVVLPGNPNVIYMGAHYYLYLSRNGGYSWQRLSRQMVLSLAMDPARPTTIYGVSLQHGLIKTTDGGAHWRSAAGNLAKGQVTGVVFDPVTRSVFAYGNGVYRTSNGGTSWAPVLPGHSIANMAVDSAGTLYAATDNGLYLSHNHGATWSSPGTISNQPVIQVAAAKHTAYAVAAIGVFKTSNSGRSWKMLGNAPTGIEFVGVSAANPAEVIGEVGNQGFYVSRNGGATWQHTNSGITDHNFASSTVRVAPSAPNVVYTGAWGLHFYASHDGGRHWTKTASLTR